MSNDGPDLDVGWMSKSDEEVGRGAPPEEVGEEKVEIGVEERRKGRAHGRTCVQQLLSCKLWIDETHYQAQARLAVLDRSGAACSPPPFVLVDASLSHSRSSLFTATAYPFASVVSFPAPSFTKRAVAPRTAAAALRGRTSSSWSFAYSRCAWYFTHSRRLARSPSCCRAAASFTRSCSTCGMASGPRRRL